MVCTGWYCVVLCANIGDTLILPHSSSFFLLLPTSFPPQPTLEIVRQIVENDAIAFLDKDKRGDMKQCEDLQYIAAMSQPGGGKNFIPNRLLRHFLPFNLVLPAINSINEMYGQMLDGRFTPTNYDGETLDIVGQLTEATIQLWDLCKTKMLPTPAKVRKGM